MQYVDVILPLPLGGMFTYSVTADTEHVEVGSRVVVQFGNKKYYTAIVSRIYHSDEKEEEKKGIKEIKDIVAVLDHHPIVGVVQLRFWEWMASYYMCSIGDVYKAALPSALKLESETHVLRNADFAPDADAETDVDLSFTPKERNVFYALSDSRPLRISEIEKLSNTTNVFAAIKSLVDKGAAVLSEDIGKNYAPKTVTVVRFAKTPDKKLADNELNTILDELHRAPKQQHLLLTFIRLHAAAADAPLRKKTLLTEADVAPAVLLPLVKKGILILEEQEVSRFDYGDANMNAAYALNEYQQQAYEEVKTSFGSKDVTLLHGVTSSGKTEIYIQLIKDAMAAGKQVLYLLPEIALTTQITSRLKTVFGNKLAVYHSKFNENERAEIWNKLLSDNECQVILGARSAIFLPFSRLGLIVVDEEHEGSYKQQDPAPRYNARNAAIMLAGMCDAKVLLGSATPAIETYAHAQAGRYGLVQLTRRYDDIALPHIEPVNVKELRRTKQMKSTILSPPLVAGMRAALERSEQVILFQNRRGFSSMIECKTCSWTPRCTHCDVSLTYHKGQQMMVCHYCGTTYKFPTVCDECKTETLDTLGYGTERVEEEVLEQLDTTVARMDLDTTRSRHAYERIISDFEDGQTDVLIGTQMVSKGLDFDNVSLVGILNADNLLNYPDFRAHERAFQLMAQVSGRAGRKNKQGHVMLQTSQPLHPIISFVRSNDYESFYQMQMQERQLFRYPPYFRLIVIVIRGRHESLVDDAGRQFAQSLRQTFGERVLGSVKPPVSRIQSLYIRKIMLKVENQASIAQVRESILHHQSTALSDKRFNSLLVHYDVDPM